jgi:Zn-dependent alcohol dehydrogenase
MGAGGIGTAIVQGARIAGAARIFVSDPNADRREFAQEMGATDVIDPTAIDVVAAVHGATGVGVDYAFDAVGSAALVGQGVAATRSGGTTVMVGAPPIDDNLSLNVVTATITEKKLMGSMLGSCHGPRDIPMLAGLWRSGQLNLEAMITGRRGLDGLNEAMADMHAGRGLRTIIDVHAEGPSA